MFCNLFNLRGKSARRTKEKDIEAKDPEGREAPLDYGRPRRVSTLRRQNPCERVGSREMCNPHEGPTRTHTHTHYIAER